MRLLTSSVQRGYTRLRLFPILIALSAAAQQSPSRFQAVVEPVPTENLAGPCHFEMSIPVPQRTVRAVWLTYDRGYDITRYYHDAEAIAFAQKHAIALVLARQCPAKNPPTLGTWRNGHGSFTWRRSIDFHCVR